MRNCERCSPTLPSADRWAQVWWKLDQKKLDSFKKLHWKDTDQEIKTGYRTSSTTAHAPLLNPNVPLKKHSDMEAYPIVGYLGSIFEGQCTQEILNPLSKCCKCSGVSAFPAALLSRRRHWCLYQLPGSWSHSGSTLSAQWQGGHGSFWKLLSLGSSSVVPPFPGLSKPGLWLEKLLLQTAKGDPAGNGETITVSFLTGPWIDGTKFIYSLIL